MFICLTQTSSGLPVEKNAHWQCPPLIEKPLSNNTDDEGRKRHFYFALTSWTRFQTKWVTLFASKRSNRSWVLSNLLWASGSFLCADFAKKQGN